jgi:nitroreductase
MMNVTEAVSSRRSVRAFRDTPIALETLTRVLDRARWAPSGCNFQPWEATVLTGAPLAGLQAKLLASEPDDPLEYEFSAPGAREKYQNRLKSLGATMYGSLRIGREDADMRSLFSQQNLTSFGAPVLLLCHFPKLMLAPQWSDVGMWLQTIMLLLRDEGLDSCPQEWMGVYGRTIKAHLGLDMEDTMLFCGLAIGERDPDHPVNNFERERVPLDEHVRFAGF